MKPGNMAPPEVLAPAGSPEALLAAVRAGADAVYLGGKQMNARRGAQNFDEAQLAQAVSYCHSRNVKVYFTLNTLVFQQERGMLLDAIEVACRAEVDALIVQDLAVAALARCCAPNMPLHASTQMSIHNLAATQQLEELGFSRVVLARELSLREIERIHRHSNIELECFVHGALCMSVSGQCYMSAALGGRSGNRGLCAQPCRLPFSALGNRHALSLKDLCAIPAIPQLQQAGVCSLKIEGRLKRPEYVAAAVMACKKAISGQTPDIKTLQSVFSRSGFTNGYIEGTRGSAMFGTREKEDVAAAAPVLKQLQGLYGQERQAVGVNFTLQIRAGAAACLSAVDAQGNRAHAKGATPQEAKTAPITPEKAAAALQKTGGTIYFADTITCDIAPGLMLPAAALNALRREVLGQLDRQRSAVKQIGFTAVKLPEAPQILPEKQEIRVRAAVPAQLTPALFEQADKVIFPLGETANIPAWALQMPEKLITEIPRLLFDEAPVRQMLQRAKKSGIACVLAGNLGGVQLAKQEGFAVVGDYSLNIVNDIALAEYRKIGLTEATLGLETHQMAARQIAASIPRGMLAYGRLPLMLTRNSPGGKMQVRQLVDRKGAAFAVVRAGDGYELLNSVPLNLSDRLADWPEMHFFTLYFTTETAAECQRVLRAFREQTAPTGTFTRGMYYRKIT